MYLTGEKLSINTHWPIQLRKSLSHNQYPNPANLLRPPFRSLFLSLAVTLALPPAATTLHPITIHVIRYIKWGIHLKSNLLILDSLFAYGCPSSLYFGQHLAQFPLLLLQVLSELMQLIFSQLARSIYPIRQAILQYLDLSNVHRRCGFGSWIIYIFIFI